MSDAFLNLDNEDFSDDRGAEEEEKEGAELEQTMLTLEAGAWDGQNL